VQLFGGTLTYSFAMPVDAFGAFLTGINLTGETLRFNDGSSETLMIPNSGGGVEFFGFTDTGRQISSITVSANAGSFGDIIGMDDVRFFAAAAAVPEPTSLVLLGISLAGLGFLRRRRGAAQDR
jgi:PEP-CTERM motif-containing protein